VTTRDPRIAFSVVDGTASYRSVGLSGTVRAITGRTTTHLDE